MPACELSLQKAHGERVCFVTDDISTRARTTLSALFHYVIRVPAIVTDRVKDQNRQYLPYVFTRLHALRLGRCGDLGFSYEKVVILDADILPIRYYDHLFLLDAPAAILNEHADTFKDRNGAENGSVYRGRWSWHEQYDDIPHGWPVPCSVTDRVRYDTQNYGMNTALLVIHPSMAEYEGIRDDLRQPDVQSVIAARYMWPDMQYLTLRWSGRWRNIDLCYAGMNGYPDIDRLFGTHYAGIKPWNFKSKTVKRRFCRFKDYQFWYSEYIQMMDAYPEFRNNALLRSVDLFARMVCEDRSA